MKPSVYIETTIPSFYFESRPEPEMVARRQWTRDWWDNHRSNYELLTSKSALGQERYNSSGVQQVRCRLERE